MLIIWTAPSLDVGICSNLYKQGLELEEVISGESISDTISSMSLWTSTTNENLQIYTESQSFLYNFVANYKKLSEDNGNKTIVHNCNTIVNLLITDEPSWKPLYPQLIHKNLANLLMGKSVVMQKTKVPAIKSPHLLDLCINLVAEKFIASHVKSQNQQTAFCHAEVIVRLWREIPRFGKLLLAHFYSKCPYLVPLHPDFADGNTMHTQKMTGLMGLYAAITVSDSSPGFKNPFGLERGWHWLASFLNLEPKPHPNVSADLLLTFLEIVYSKLRITYGPVFNRILAYIWHSYTDMLNEDEMEEPVAKLMKFIQKYSTTI